MVVEVCTSCRLEGGSGSNGPQSGSIVDGEKAVKQLFETVNSLCAAVGTATNNMKQLMQTAG